MIIQDLKKFKTTDLPIEESKLFVEIVLFLRNFYQDEEFIAAKYIGGTNGPSGKTHELLQIHNPSNKKMELILRLYQNQDYTGLDIIGFPLDNTDIFDLESFETELNDWISKVYEYIDLQSRISDDYFEEDATQFDNFFSDAEKASDEEILSLKDQEKIENLLIALTNTVNQIPDIDDERKENILRYIETTAKILPNTKKGLVRKRIIKIFAKIKNLGVKALTFAGKKLIESSSKKASDSVIDDVVSIIKDVL